MAPTTTSTTRHACYGATGPCRPYPAHVVGKAFTCKYYDTLCRSPEKAYMFYHDNSCLARPSGYGGDGTYDNCVTTLEAINTKITETRAGMVSVEILTVDSHYSHGGGVSVVVTGSTVFAGDASPRAFVQSFFLAPQDTKDYYVRNDTLRYISGGAASMLPRRPLSSPAMAADDEKGRKSPGSELSAAMTSEVIAAAEEEKGGDVPGDKTEEHSREREEVQDAAASNRLGNMLGKLRRLFVSQGPQAVPVKKNEPQDVPIKNNGPEPEENGFLVID